MMHQPLDAVAADLLAGAPQRELHPTRSVGVVFGLVDLTDALDQPLVLEGPRRSRPVARW